MPYTQVILSPDPQFLQAEAYDAKYDRTIFSDLLGQGVADATHYAVTINAGLQLSVAPGIAYVNGAHVFDQGMYRQRIQNAVLISVGAHHATLPRLDQVILRIMDGAHDASTKYEGRIEVIPGTPTAGATLVNRAGANPLTNLDEDSDNILLLSDVLVPATSGAVTLADKRTIAKIGGGAVDLALDTPYYTLYQEIVLGADTATIDFQNIPATYKHIEVVYRVRAADAATHKRQLQLLLNNDTGAGKYQYRSMKQAALYQHSLSDTKIILGEVGASQFPAIEPWTTGVIEIPYYTEGATLDGVNGLHRSYGRTEVAGTEPDHGQFNSVFHYDAAVALNRLTLDLDSGNFLTGSRASVYLKRV